MGEGKASLFEGSFYGVDTLMRDENVVGEIRRLKENGSRLVRKSARRCLDKTVRCGISTHIPARARGEVSSRTLWPASRP